MNAISSTSVSTPAPASGFAERLAIAAGDIKLSHSIFAMPFALLAAFLARPVGMSWRDFGALLALVVVCMIVARSWAMLVNRLADRLLDARNPRTASRAFASGRLSAPFGICLAVSLACAFLFITSVFWFAFANPWPVLLAIPVLAWIGLYSLTKRFTWACHLFLGTSLAASPLAAAIAVNPGALGLTGAPVVEGVQASLWCLAAMVTFWVAGFDIIYSLQDVEADRREGLFSLPSKMGVRGAIWTSRFLHIAAFFCLALAWRTEPRMQTLFGVGVGLVGFLLIIEHAILAKRGKAGLDAAFFTMNGLVSLVVGVLGMSDAVL